MTRRVPAKPTPERGAKRNTAPARRVLGHARPDAAFPGAPPAAGLPRDYAKVLADLKRRIECERLRVVLSANTAMVLLYWDIGWTILDRQSREGWGARVIDRLAADLHEAFPDMRGFSPRNLKYMRALAATWPDRAIVQQLAAQIPWFHNCVLLERVSDPVEREWYVRQTIEHGWSRSILALQIDRQAHRRTGKAVSNFSRTLPPTDSDLARRRSRIRTSSTFSVRPIRAARPRSSGHLWIMCSASSWNWAPGLRSWAGRSIWRWAARTSTLTCCSTTCGCGALWSWN